VRRLFLTFFICVVLAVLAALSAGAYALWWLNQPLPMNSASADLLIDPGMTPRTIAQAVAAAGVRTSPQRLYWWFRLSGRSRQMRAGSYELERGLTPRALLAVLVRGREATNTVVLVEGWNWRQVRAALAKAEQLKQESANDTDYELMARLGRPDAAPEGRFFPNTYTYSKGSTDTALLQRAMRLMDHELAAAWAARDSDLPLKSPDEALTLASIVEKETGRAQDRSQVAAVFVNRLRLGMPLQTDPSVIYGMGTAYDGHLHRHDLETDTPWNTYTRTGLPPTPIAMPGRASLLAAVRPASSDMLYFVSRGDGSSQFSRTLGEHNRAVNRYQRGVQR
jgi:UPF0755 protein